MCSDPTDARPQGDQWLSAKGKMAGKGGTCRSDENTRLFTHKDRPQLGAPVHVWGDDYARLFTHKDRPQLGALVHVWSDDNARLFNHEDRPQLCAPVHV
jgi:hypothetical protein